MHSRGATPELVLDFLVIAAEEVSSADFIGAAKSVFLYVIFLSDSPIL
jgi:hypothetical protein